MCKSEFSKERQRETSGLSRVKRDGRAASALPACFAKCRRFSPSCNTCMCDTVSGWCHLHGLITQRRLAEATGRAGAFGRASRIHRPNIITITGRWNTRATLVKPPKAGQNMVIGIQDLVITRQTQSMFGQSWSNIAKTRWKQARFGQFGSSMVRTRQQQSRFGQSWSSNSQGVRQFWSNPLMG